MTDGDQRRPKRALSVRVRRTGGALLVARGEDIFELSDVSMLLWQLSDGTRTVDDLVAAVTAEYDVSAKEAHGDLLAFVGEMVAARFMEWA